MSSTASNSGVFRVIDHPSAVPNVREEILLGLRSTPKWLPPKLFYDERGSGLFEEITRLPEYYLTRTEISILRAHAREMIPSDWGRTVLIEPGSGNSSKVGLLLDVSPQVCGYMPIDVSRDQLLASAELVSRDYPHVEVIAVCADYGKLESFPEVEGYEKRCVFFPGSTVGNLEPADVSTFFARLRGALRPGDIAIIGVDLKKPSSVVEPAYDDSAGVTAAFNLNLLNHVNSLANASFDPSQFRHRAFFNEEESRIEMHLVSREKQSVRVGAESISFEKDETIHTENSYKYAPGRFAELVEPSGFEVDAIWKDSEEMFSVQRLRARNLE